MTKHEYHRIREGITCARLGGTHLGGSGKPDCVMPGRSLAEIKDWKRPLRAGDVNKILSRPMYSGSNTIICAIGPGGFTKAAERRARELGATVSACNMPPLTRARRRKNR